MNHQQDLLTAPSENPTEVAAPAGVPVIVTNRSNVMEWLSSGLLTPRAAFGKYYEDSLEFSEYAIPVVRAPMSGELLEIGGGTAGNFPVLAEVDADAVHWLDPAASLGMLEADTLSVLTALHFRSNEERSEFAAREFENVRKERAPCETSPELFGGESQPTREELQRALGTASPSKPALDFRTADRLSGAQLLSLRAATASESQLENLSKRIFGKPAKRPPRKKLVHALDWLYLTESLAAYAPKKNAGFDERVFLACAAVFLDQDRSNAWDAAAVLSEIDQTLSHDDAISAENRARWSRASERIATYLRGDDPFVRFRDDKPGVEKALLLGLIRDTPEAVLSWRDEDIGAHEDDLLLAAALVGLRHGRKAMSVDLRPPSLDAALASLEVSGLRGRQIESNVTVEIRKTEMGPRLVMSLDGGDVFEAKLPPPTAAQVMEELDPGSPVTVSGLVEIATQRGWTSALRTTIVIRGPVELKAVRGAVEVVADGVPEIETSVRTSVFKKLVESSDDDSLRADLLLLKSDAESNS